MTDEQRLPIEDAPRDGSTILAARGANLAVCHWTGGMWAYGHKDDGVVEQVDFEPTHYLLRGAAA